MTLKSDQDHQSCIVYFMHVCTNRDLCHFLRNYLLQKGQHENFLESQFLLSLKKNNISSCFSFIFGISIELYGVMYINRYWAILLSKWMQSLCWNKKIFIFKLYFIVITHPFYLISYIQLCLFNRMLRRFYLCRKKKSGKFVWTFLFLLTILRKLLLP